MTHFPFGKRGPGWPSKEAFLEEFMEFVSANPKLRGIRARKRAFALSNGMIKSDYARFSLGNRVLTRLTQKGPRARSAIRRIRK